MAHIPRLSLTERVDYLFELTSRLTRENKLAMSNISDLTSALTRLESIASSTISELQTATPRWSMRWTNIAPTSKLPPTASPPSPPRFRPP